jgi:RsiW-degrading membrane proteinase PrsW (M82 family)
MKTGSKRRSGLWLSTAFSIVGLLLIVLLSFIADKTLSLGTNSVLLWIISLLIAFIPPIIWLTVFYRQDRLDPEPKSYVFKTLILGALIQKAVYAPLIELAGIQSGSKSVISDYIFTVILVALIQESMKLLSVRYALYHSSEFDEKIDGIIYGSALGLGFAAMTNLDLIISNGGAALSAVSSIVVIESLGHASFTGLSCYFLSVSKYQKFSIVRLPAAVIIATSLNAVSRILIDKLVRAGFKVNYIIGIIPAALVAVAVFGLLVFITSKSSGKETEGEVATKKEAAISVIPVWALLVAALAVGFAISSIPEKTSTVAVDDNINITYPASWTQFSKSGDLFRASDVISGGGRNFVSVKKTPLESLISYKSGEGSPALEDIAAAWSIKSGRDYKYYQPTKAYPLQYGGQDAYVTEYVYISGNTQSTVESRTPGIGYSRDIILLSYDNVFIVTISTEYNDWVLKKDNFSRVKLSPGSN